jgi:hypothetical protein
MSPPDDNDGNTHAGNAAEGNGTDCRVGDGTFHSAAPAAVRPHRRIVRSMVLPQPFSAR